MVGSSAANKDNYKVTTPSDHEIRLTRLFNAPRLLMFEAVTRAEHVRHGGAIWAKGTRSRSARSIFASAGRGAWSTAHPKGEAAFHGEYREIDPPGRVVFTEIFEMFPDTVSVATAELTEEGGQTRRHQLRSPGGSAGRTAPRVASPARHALPG